MSEGVVQVVNERDSLQQSLADLQRQRQDVMGQSREIGAKFDTVQEEVGSTLVCSIITVCVCSVGVSSNRGRETQPGATDGHKQSRSGQHGSPGTNVSGCGRWVWSTPPPRELAKAGEMEVQGRLDEVVRERDSTLSRAQEMSDRLMDVERERDSLQEIVVRSSGEISRLQDEQEDITRRWGDHIHTHTHTRTLVPAATSCWRRQ